MYRVVHSNMETTENYTDRLLTSLSISLKKIDALQKAVSQVTKDTGVSEELTDELFDAVSVLETVLDEIVTDVVAELSVGTPSLDRLNDLYEGLDVLHGFVYGTK